MMHKGRVWCVVDLTAGTLAERIDQLTEKLTEHTWTNCAGWRLEGFLFLNDQTSENGAFEVAIVREADLVQTESITFSWCTKERARELIERIVKGNHVCVWSGIAGITALQLQTWQEHGACRHCA